MLELCPVLPQPEDTLGRIAFAKALAAGEGGASSELWGDARTHLHNAISLGAPNQSELLRMLARVNLELHEPAEAEQALTRAVQSKPEDLATWPVYFEYAREHGRMPALEGILEAQISRLAAQDGPRPEAVAAAYFWLGRVYGEDGNSEEAAAAYVQAAQAAPYTPEVWRRLLRLAADETGVGALRDTLASLFPEPAKVERWPLAAMESIARAWEGGPSALGDATQRLAVLIAGRAASEEEEDWGEYLSVAELLSKELSNAGPATPGLMTARVNLAYAYLELGRIETADELSHDFQAGSGAPEEEQIFLRVRTGILVYREQYADVETLLKDEAPLVRKDLFLSEALANALAHNGRTAGARLRYMTILRTFHLSQAKREEIEAEVRALGGVNSAPGDTAEKEGS